MPRISRELACGLILLLAGICVSGGLCLHHRAVLARAGNEINGVQMVTNNDGYYHLLRARELADQPVSRVLTTRTESLLLPEILAMLGGRDQNRAMGIAGFMGPLMGLTMLFAVFPWTTETRSRWLMLLAPLMALFAPFWLDRTHAGVLDTDGLVPFLTYFALFCVMKFSAASRRRLWILLYVLTLCASWLWWKPGTFLSLGFLALYVVHPSRRRPDIICKAIMAGAAILFLLLAWAGVAPFSDVVHFVMAHVKLAFGATNHSLLSDAIVELGNLSPAELGNSALGSPWLLPVVVAGVVMYVRQQGRDALFLVPGGVIFCAAALLSRRFLILFIPAAVFFAGYFVVFGCGWLRRRLPRLQKGSSYTALCVLASCLLLWAPVEKGVNYVPKSYFSPSDFKLARELKQSFPPDTRIWSWWDYGYFLHYLTGMQVYFDGGSQTDLSCFTAAYPLMQDNPVLAARWIRHFSNPENEPLNLAVGVRDRSAHVAAISAKMKPEPPSLHTALCLPARVYTAVGYLYAFAHIFDTQVPRVGNHLDLFPKQGFSYEPENSLVVIPQAMSDKGYESVGAVLDATGKTPQDFDFAKLPDPYLIHSRGTDFLTVTDRLLVNSVLVRLLGQFSYDTTHFQPVTFDYRTGGIWRVR